MNNTKLKPCPFCGGKAELYKSWWLGQYFQVTCTKCRVTTRVGGTKKGIAAMWNRRTDE